MNQTTIVEIEQYKKMHSTKEFAAVQIDVPWNRIEYVLVPGQCQFTCNPLVVGDRELASDVELLDFWHFAPDGADAFGISLSGWLFTPQDTYGLPRCLHLWGMFDPRVDRDWILKVCSSIRFCTDPVFSCALNREHCQKSKVLPQVEFYTLRHFQA